MPQIGIPAVIMRGGSSKGIFIRYELLPPAGPDRDAVVLALLGSPDAMQIDGLGGTHSSTSKVMAVGPSKRPGIDVDYLLAQGAAGSSAIGYNANCGNLTSAAAAFAIDEGMVPAVEPLTIVRMYNDNTGKVVHVAVPVSDGEASATGDHHIAGVPGTGARIVTEYIEPGGSTYGALLPTNHPIDTLTIPGGSIEVSIVDATMPIVFLRPGDIGLVGDELPEEINKNADLLVRIEQIRGAATVLLGGVERLEDASTLSMASPKIGWVSPPRDTVLVGGKTLRAVEMDILARMVSVGKAHHALPLTALMCTAAAALLPGTIPFEASRATGGEIRVGIAKGVVTANVDLGDKPDDVRSVSVDRTARRIMAGTVYIQPGTAAALALARHPQSSA